MKRKNLTPPPQGEPSQAAVPPRDKGAEFIKEYETLCAKFGVQFVAVPTFRPRDDGTFSIVVQWQLGVFNPSRPKT